VIDALCADMSDLIDTRSASWRIKSAKGFDARMKKRWLIQLRQPFTRNSFARYVFLSTRGHSPASSFG